MVLQTFASSYGQLLLIAALAAVIRLYRLESWPVFIDEDIYTMGSLLAVQTSWPDGLLRATNWATKPPLFMVLQGLFGRVVGDPVVVGRALCGLSGVVTTVLTFFLGRRLAGPWVGLVAATLYALSPLAVLHERMVLQDGPLTAAFLGAVLAAWVAVERRSWRFGLLAGLLGALAVQFKLPGIAASGVPLLFWAVRAGRRLDRLGPALVASVGPLLSYAALMGSPFGPAIALQSAQLMQSNPIGANLELLNTAEVQPFGNAPAHFGHLRDAIVAYFPAGLYLLVPLGAAMAARQNLRLLLVFGAIILGLSLPWPFLSRLAPSRYYLPAVPFVSALAAVALVGIPRLAAGVRRPAGLVAGVAAVVIVLASGLVSWAIVTSHRTAPLTKLDDWQYRSGSVSGYGYQEAGDFIATNTRPGSAAAYFVDQKHLIAVGFHRSLPTGVRSLGVFDVRNPLPAVSSGPLFIVVDDLPLQPIGQRRQQLLAAEPRLEPVAQFRRPGSDAGVYVLRLGQ